MILTAREVTKEWLLRCRLAIFFWNRHVSTWTLKIPLPRKSLRMVEKFFSLGKFLKLVLSMYSMFSALALIVFRNTWMWMVLFDEFQRRGDLFLEGTRQWSWRVGHVAAAGGTRQWRWRDTIQELGLQFQAIILTSKMRGDHFVTEGFSDWKNSQRLANHATSSNSHVDCVHMSYALMNPNQSIKATFVNQTKQMNSEYHVCVNTSLIATKFLLSDVAGKEQMVVVIRYVNSEGLVKERFLGIVSVKETSAKSLKEALEKLLSINGLSLLSIRGQGYDGASNMRGKFGDLRTFIQNENPSTYYVHCFAHQLQLALVACAKTHKDVSGFSVRSICLLISYGLLIREEFLREKQVSQFAKLIEEGQIETGSGLNQESSIARAGDTRWGSHFRTLTSLMTIYGAIIEVLEKVGKDTSFEKYGEIMLLLDMLQSFDFIFMLYMMVKILGFTNDLSVALQKRDQDLLNALSLVKATKEELQEMRNGGWKELISKVMEICNKHDIDVLDLDAPYVQGKKPRRHATTSSVSNLHHYKHDCLFSVSDLQLHELNARFDEENIELLQCVSCLSPSSSFEAFDVKKLLRMVELYPNDFVDVPKVVVRHQLQNYVRNVRCDPKFVKLKGLSDLCAKLVETKKCNTFDIVYRLLKLVLVLSVATASVERVFSSMKFVKSQLCNKMGDQWLNDRLVTFIKRDVLGTINNDVILAHFQKMGS
ncbi:Zinc finger MYM-type protein 1 [Glycine soja]|uniref:Zinc finger MYM-type protein 1 n=1 Tax=Glycine soja TaxID=3848 RepID=A0A445IIV7_GLYSO|nr:Zinc finger MYM-type protein 1 [Glycine soja]